MRLTFAFVFDGEVSGQIETVDDLLDVGDALFDFFLVRREMSGDEEERSTENHEGRGDGAFGFERSSRSNAQGGLFRYGNVPDEVATEEYCHVNCTWGKKSVGTFAFCVGKWGRPSEVEWKRRCVGPKVS